MAVTVFAYSDFGKQPGIFSGRFFYQKDGASRWHLDTCGGYLWRKDGVVWIDLERNHYRLFSNQEVLERTKRLASLKQQGRSWANLLILPELIDLCLVPMEPKDVVPFLFGSDPAVLRANYVLSVESKNGKWFVTGKSKQPDDVEYSIIAFIFDGDSKLPAAIRVQRRHKSYTTYEFTNVKVDATVADDDMFLHPDISMLKDTSLGAR